MATASAKAPMSDDQKSLLRARVTELRQADVQPKHTWKSIFDLLVQDEPLKTFVTPGRVEKTWLDLEGNQQDRAKLSDFAAQKAAIVAGLSEKAPQYRPWPEGKSLSDALEKGEDCIFSNGEKLQANFGLGGAPIGVSADFDYRQSIAAMASFVGKRINNMILQDKDQKSAIILIVRSSYQQPSSTRPFFIVEYSSAKRTDPDIMDHVRIIDQLGSSSIGTIQSSIEEQKLWLTELRNNQLPGKAAFAKMRRSCVIPMFQREEQVCVNFTEAAPKVCGHCDGAASLSCGRCHGIQYCCPQCQAADWKVHKKSCLPAPSSAADATSVCIPVVDKSVTGDMVMSLVNMSQGMGISPIASLTQPPPNPHGAKRFIVKVQIPMSASADPMRDPTGHQMMIYDEGRLLQRLFRVQENAAEYAKLAAFVRRVGYRSVRAYLYARREGEFLRMYVPTVSSEAPSQTQQW